MGGILEQRVLLSRGQSVRNKSPCVYNAVPEAADHAAPTASGLCVLEFSEWAELNGPSRGMNAAPHRRPGKRADSVAHDPHRRCLCCEHVEFQRYDQVLVPGTTLTRACPEIHLQPRRGAVFIELDPRSKHGSPVAQQKKAASVLKERKSREKRRVSHVERSIGEGVLVALSFSARAAITYAITLGSCASSAALSRDF